MGVPVVNDSVSAMRVVRGHSRVRWEVLLDEVVGLFQGVGVGGVGGGCAVL